VDVASRVLDATPPGTLTAVLGSPGAGVSTLLAAVCSAAASSKTGGVLASWERPPTASTALLASADVGLPEVINWGLQELARCPELRTAPAATAVALDYLQLIDHSVDAANTTASLRTLTADKGWRSVLGVAVPRVGVDGLGDVLARVDCRLLITMDDRGGRQLRQLDPP
jgi:hypothetical protein